MDRVSAGGRAGRGGVHNRSFDDEGYAAHAASPLGHKRGRERSDSGGRRDRKSSSTRDEFKEYALALRKRDRRGRVDEPAERERPGGRFRRDRDYTHVSWLSDVRVCACVRVCVLPSCCPCVLFCFPA